MNAGWTRRTALKAVTGALLAPGQGLVAGPALAAAGRSAREHADDLVSIIEHHGRYSFAADLSEDPADYAGLFTGDGAFIGLQGRGGSPEGVRGREAILKFAAESKARPGRNEAFFVHHNQSCNVVFALGGDEALTRSYLLATSVSGAEPAAPRVGSEYEDRMVRTPQGWRIFERRAGKLEDLPPAVFAAPFPRPPALDKEDAMALAAFDRLEIIDVVNRWSHAADGSERAALDRVMTADAVLEIAERKGAPRAIEGLEAIWTHLGAGSGRAREIRRHVRNTVILAGGADSATAQSYYIVTVGERPPGLAMIATGLYVDELTRTPAGWRIRHRKVVPDGSGGEEPRG